MRRCRFGRIWNSLRQVFATGAPAVSDVYMGAVGPRLVVAIDVPVKRDDGSVAYVLSTNPALEDFDAILRRQRPPEGWLVSVYDRRGVNVARTLNPERFVGTLAGSDILGFMQVAREGIFENVSRDGIGLVSAFSHSTKFGWSVAVGVPRVQLMAPALRAATRTLGAGGILLALSIALALLVARQITGPIAALRRLAAKGEGDAAPASGSTGLREADEVVRALTTAEDERRASEHDREKARAALQESEEKLLQSQKMEAFGQLTGGLAHDFNNLLLVIIGNLDDLLDGKKCGPAEQELARQALEAAQRGADLTRSLLAFARRQPLQPQRIAINDLMSGIARLLGRTLGERIEVSLELAPGIWPVVADPAQLEAALTNLATNARDAMPKGGHLTIATANRHLDDDYGAQHADVFPGDYAMIEVSDTGTGMPPERGGADFRPVLHHQGRGRRHRPRAEHGVRLHEAVGGPYQCLQRARRRNDVSALPAARSEGGQRRGRQHPGGELERRRRDGAGGRGQSGAAPGGRDAIDQARIPGAGIGERGGRHRDPGRR